MRTLVGGIGYRNLRDYSIGGAVVDALEHHVLPGDVVVEDVSYSPIAFVQRLDDEAPDRRFGRAIFVGTAARNAGRLPGTVTAYRWDRALPSPALIQTAVTEGITGIISLDNTLVVARHFGALPEEVLVVEVEPAVHEFGETFSDEVAAAMQPVQSLVVLLATDLHAGTRLPEAPLGGGWFHAGHGLEARIRSGSDG